MLFAEVAGGGILWTVVAVLLILALIVFIVRRP